MVILRCKCKKSGKHRKRYRTVHVRAHTRRCKYGRTKAGSCRVGPKKRRRKR